MESHAAGLSCSSVLDAKQDHVKKLQLHQGWLVPALSNYNGYEGESEWVDFEGLVEQVDGAPGAEPEFQDVYGRAKLPEKWSVARWVPIEEQHSVIYPC